MPHLRYGGDHAPHAALWGREHTSSITQPPMYGHALATLSHAGIPVSAELVARATRGLRFLLDLRRRSSAGLVELCHPWESGCDDSPRWDSVLPEPWTSEAFYEAKGSLVSSIERTSDGSPVANPAFAVGSVAFTALVAFNALELCSITADDRLRAEAHDLVAALDARWRPELGTWVDDGLTEGGSGRVRTLEALLPAPRDPTRRGRSRSSSIQARSAPSAGRGACTGRSLPTSPGATGGAPRGRSSPTCCG